MKRIADYRVVRPLGAGNHGRFFLAEAPARLGLDDRLVAVKVLDTHADGQAFDRVANELRIFANVRSPYLVPLLDAGHDRGQLFYAVQYHPLGSLAYPARPLGADEVLRAVAHAARGAHDLHEAGISHRDIKPANVLLTEDGGRLSDLGLATLLSPGMSVSGIGPVGAIEYMDPQVVLGHRATRASDVWSLGMTLHRALSRRSAYESVSAVSLVQMLRDVRGRQPRLDPSLDPTIAGIVGDCLAPDPTDRPESAAVVADRIEALLVEAPP